MSMAMSNGIRRRWVMAGLCLMMAVAGNAFCGVSLTSITLDPEKETGETSNAPGAWSTGMGDILSQVGVMSEAGVFLNQGASAGTLGEINIPLQPGTNRFTLFGNGIFGHNDYYGAVLFFDGIVTPPVAAVYNRNGATGPFSIQPKGITIMGGANGGHFFDPAPGTNVYRAPDGTKVEIVSFTIDSISQTVDKIAFITIGSNGVFDTTAQLVLKVTEPSIYLVAPARVQPDALFVVDVMAESDDLYGIQATVTADPGKAALLGSAYGDIFDPSQRLEIPFSVDPQLGSVLGAMSLCRPATLFSGNGLFATLSYRASHILGPVILSCDGMLAGIDGTNLPVCVHGATVIVDDGIWGAGSISGNITYPYGSDHSGIQVHLWHNGQLFRTVTTDSQGNFTFAEVKDGTYRITATAPLYVLEPFEAVVSGGGSTTVPAKKMLAGDLNSDKVIDIGDLTLMAAAFGTSTGQTGFNPVADINKDGKVNILDLTILASHWGVSGN